MATTVSFYTQANKRLKNVSFPGAGLTLHLVTSAYTPSAAHTDFDTSVAAHEVTDSSYAPVALANIVMTDDAIDADDTVFPLLDATFRYAVMRITTTGESPPDNLVCWYLIDDTPADVVVAGTNYQFVWNASGVFLIPRTNA